jgi:hypothetical protein
VNKASEARGRFDGITYGKRGLATEDKPETRKVTGTVTRREKILSGGYTQIHLTVVVEDQSEDIILMGDYSGSNRDWAMCKPGDMHREAPGAPWQMFTSTLKIQFDIDEERASLAFG